MTDEFDANDMQDDDDEQQYGGDNPNLRQLRSKARKFDSVTQELNTLRRQVAFTEAGIPDGPQRKLLEKVYDGEPTKEAIRAFATEYGVIDASDVPSDELDALDRVAQLGVGAPNSQPREQDFNAMIRRAAGRQ